MTSKRPQRSDTDDVNGSGITVAAAVARLRAGEVVGLPTETVYGLAGSIQSAEGLGQIFSLKERPFFDPLIVHVLSIDQAQGLVLEWPPLADFLARRFWPGPLTLILPKNDRVHPLITAGLMTVGLRQPRHRLALELIRELGCPVAAPSANKFGKTSPSEAAHVTAEFPGTLVLDGGPCEMGLESTVIELRGTGLVILRPGGVTVEQLTAAAAEFSATADLSEGVSVSRAESQASPGHLKHHYMPAIPLVQLSHEGAPSTDELIWISEQLGVNVSRPVELSLARGPDHVARLLYHDMRVAAESGADLIFVYRGPKQYGGYWDAIWDRLGRAASLAL